SFDGRPAQLLQPPTQVPDGKLVHGADGVALVEFELGRHPDPAGDSLGIAGDWGGNAPVASRGVGAGRREPATVGTERDAVDGAAVLEHRAYGQARACIPKADGAVLAAAGQDR